MQPLLEEACALTCFILLVFDKSLAIAHRKTPTVSEQDNFCACQKNAWPVLRKGASISYTAKLANVADLSECLCMDFNPANYYYLDVKISLCFLLVEGLDS